MYQQQNSDGYMYQLKNELEQILKESEFELKERTNSILLEMQVQTNTAKKDVSEHIKKLATN